MLDQRILDEYRRVLARPNFEKLRTQSSKILDYLSINCEWVDASPLEINSEEIPDPSDLPFVEVAVMTQANALVTGNKRHFEFLRSWEIQVLSPAEFTQLFKS